MIKKILTLSFCFTLLLLIGCKKPTDQNTELPFQEQLQALFPTGKITKLKSKDHFKESYQLVLKQPLDHANPSKGTFDHFIFISHSSYKNPSLFVTTGYDANNFTRELSKMLKSNQVVVEYRFYGKSRPESIPWEYLTNDQALEDYHSIITKLKTIYKTKWISTGISKGGETALMFKAKYPKDVDIAVPYVAPLINTREDKRTQEHINTVGTDVCRSNILNFQRNVLKNRTLVLKELKVLAEKNKLVFSEFSLEEALEYAVLEYPFSFWQWGAKCEEIPNDKASAKKMASYLNKTVGIAIYSDKGYHNYLPSFYQHMREIGYYGFDLEPVSDLLKVVKSSSNMPFAPKNTTLTYNSSCIKEVREFVENKGNNILYVYGEYDPWFACAPNPKAEVDALKMVLKGGSHKARIRHFSEDDQQKIVLKLKDWLGNDVSFYAIE